MIRVIKERIKQIQRGEVPTGYLKTKRGILPTDWENVKIGECLQRVENPVQVEPDTMYTQIGIRSHGKGLFYKDPVMGRELKHKAVFWIEPDCFILNIVFAWEQAVGKTTSREKGMIGSHRFPMYWPGNHKVDIDYLIAYFLTKRGTEILGEASPGGAGRNRTLGQESFLKSTIVLPPIEEQEKIAKILMTQDQVITLKERYLAEKEKQKKYLMQVLLTEEKRLPGFSGVWKKERLGRLFLERKETNHTELELLAITGTQGVIPRKELDLKDNSSEDKSKYLKVCVGDIGYNTMRMWQGVSAYSNYEGIVSPAYTILKPAVDLNAKFFAYLFKLPEMVFLFYRFSQGLVDDTRNLKYENFKKIRVNYPADKYEQKAIADVLTTVDKEISLIEQEIAEEKRKKKALMQLLLTGIVRTM